MSMKNKCPYCGAEVVLRDATFVYTSNKAKDYNKVWVCSNYPKCDAYVGCHKGTTIPMGRLANARLRTLKKEAHRQFDPLWKSGLMSRKEAYRWLSNMLNIDLDECHIGMFDIKNCQRTIHLCRKQDNPVINEYRLKHYGYETKEPVFTRGYNKKKYRN